MDLWIKKDEFDALPFRDDLSGEDYIVGRLYRARAYPNGVFVFGGSLYRPQWNYWHVTLTEPT